MTDAPYTLGNLQHSPEANCDTGHYVASWLDNNCVYPSLQ